DNLDGRAAGLLRGSWNGCFARWSRGDSLRPVEQSPEEAVEFLLCERMVLEGVRPALDERPDEAFFIEHTELPAWHVEVDASRVQGLRFPCPSEPVIHQPGREHDLVVLPGKILISDYLGSDEELAQP